VPDRPVKYADRPAPCADCPSLYSDCLAPYADGPNGLSRVCTTCGGLGAGLGNSLLKMGSAAASPDGPRSRADGPDMRRSANLSPMCVGGCRYPRYMSIGCDWSCHPVADELRVYSLNSTSCEGRFVIVDLSSARTSLL
jgi:hypothetical protein